MFIWNRCVLKSTYHQPASGLASDRPSIMCFFSGTVHYMIILGVRKIKNFPELSESLSTTYCTKYMCDIVKISVLHVLNNNLSRWQWYLLWIFGNFCHIVSILVERPKMITFSRWPYLEMYSTCIHWLSAGVMHLIIMSLGITILKKTFFHRVTNG